MRKSLKGLQESKGDPVHIKRQGPLRVGGVVEGKAPVSMLKRDKEQSGETGMRGPWEP